MGRLENIIERNKNPGRHRKGGRFPLGIALAMFVFVILVLVVFTDFDESPNQPEPEAPATVDDKRVDGVLLYREPARDAGQASAD